MVIRGRIGSPVAIEARPEQPARQAPSVALALTTPPKRRAQAHLAPVGRRMAQRHVPPRFRVCEFQMVIRPHGRSLLGGRDRRTRGRQKVFVAVVY